MKKIVSLLLVAILALSAVSALAYTTPPLKGDVGGVWAAQIELAVDKTGVRTGKPLPTEPVWQVGSASGKSLGFDYVTWMVTWLYLYTESTTTAGSAWADNDELDDLIAYLDGLSLTDSDYEDAFAGRWDAIVNGNPILGLTIL